MPTRKIKETKPLKNARDVVFRLNVRRNGPEPILGAAYMMMDRAYAFISGDKKKILTVTLRPKGSRRAADLAQMKAAFENELAAQKLRWAISRNNLSVREYIAENALPLAAEFSQRAASAAAPAVEELTDVQRGEIERLIAEVESEIAEMKHKPKSPDTKVAALSWEAAQVPKTGGSGE